VKYLSLIPLAISAVFHVIAVIAVKLSDDTMAVAEWMVGIKK